MPKESKPSIVFVHGIWAYGSAFNVSELLLTARRALFRRQPEEGGDLA